MNLKAFKSDGQYLPMHMAYQRLCIIYEKKLNYDGAIETAKQALAGGWGGDWERRS